MIEQEEQAEVAGFTVDLDYMKAEELLGFPVTPSSEMVAKFPPGEYEVCLSFGYKNMVYNRKEKFDECKKRGYTIFSFVSKAAHIYTEEIGEGCNIYPGATIMPFAKIGKGCFIEAGCIIAHHTNIGEFNFIAPGVHFCGAVTTGNNCFFGGAAEIINNCVIGKEVFIGAGAIVTKNLSKGETVLPAKSILVYKSSAETMKYMFGEKYESDSQGKV